MGRLRLNTCRCVEPRPEKVTTGRGKILGLVCRGCLRMVRDWRRSEHRARVEQIEVGPYTARCIHSGLDTYEASFTLLVACAPKGEPQDMALWILDQVCTTGRHVHA